MKSPRHHFFIDPEVQLRWGIFAGTLGFMGSLLSIAVIVLAPMLIDALSQTRTIATTQILELMEQLWIWLLATAIFASAASFILGVAFSHRFIGPIYRLQKLLGKRACGQPLGRIKLRQGDFLGDFVNSVTDHVDRLAEIEQVAAQIIDDYTVQGLTGEQLAAHVDKLREALTNAFTPPPQIPAD